MGVAIIMFAVAPTSLQTSTPNAWGTTSVRTATNCYPWIQNAGNYVQVTGVQIERGTVATPFEVRNFSQELALCQTWNNMSAGTGTSNLCLNTAGGNVGIGRTDPLYRFNVDNGSTTGPACFVQASGITAGQTASFILGKTNTNNSTGTILWNHVGDGLATNYLGLGVWGGDNKLVVTASSNVGIGTTSPAYALDIGGFASSAQTLRIGATSSNACVRLMEFSDIYGFSIENIATAVAGASGARMDIVRHSGSFQGTPIMSFIRDSPNVGIGTTNPYGKLEVLGGSIYSSNTTTLSHGALSMGNGEFLTIEAFNSGNTSKLPITLGAYGGNVGIGLTNPTTYTLQVTGSIGATGDVTAFTSDERLKTKTGPITEALDKVCTLDTFTYTHNDLARSFGFTDNRHYVGISAQQVRKVQPEVVRIAPFDADGEGSKSGEDYITVQYERLVPLLIEAIKEERKMREALEERVKLLEQR